MSVDVPAGTETPINPRTSWRGITAMARHEFRLRIRAGRWRWLLVAWAIVLFLFTALMNLAVNTVDTDRPGGFVFGALMMFIIGLALLIVPALTAQSVNGDRERGVLATLQTTLLTPAEIAIGKLAAAWGTSLVFLVLSVPFVLWCMALGGVPVLRAVICFVVTGLLLGVVAAIAQCLSALLARSTTSAVLSYLTVFALTFGTLIAFWLALFATQTTETGGDYTTTEVHPEQVWWLLVPNPFLIVADATPASPAPEPDPQTMYSEDDDDPLRTIGDLVRQARDPEVWNDETGQLDSPGGQKPMWPYGLAFNLLLGGGALTLTIRRLTTPYKKLSTGVRVA